MTMTAFTAIVTAALGPWLAGGHGLVVEEYAPAEQPVELRTCTHITFVNGREVITDLGNDRFLYRDGPGEVWRQSPAPIDGAHSLTYAPKQRLYYANDTENHRMLALASLTGGDVAAEATHLAGVTLQRPHDVVYDPDTGWLYALNPNEPVVFRFKTLRGPVERLDLSAELGYSRALTLAQGALYVAGSSQGKVAGITDFAGGAYRVYGSFGHRREAPAGNWGETGLIPNDVVWYEGHWYVSSYFTPDPVYSAPGRDADRNKLIRFEAWDDFETGRWEELSALLPRGVTPYFFTSHGGALYLAAFHHGGESEGRVYRITRHAPHGTG